MAVQTHYQSNALSPVLRSTVLEAHQMWQNPEHQSGQFRIDDAANNVPLSSMAAAAIALPQQQPGFPNPAFAAVPITSTVGLHMSIDQRIPVFQSGGTSTSGRPKKVSTQSGSSFSQELLLHIRNHNIEIDALLNHHRNMLREGLEEMQKRYWKSVLVTLERNTSKRILEKDAELENVKRRNSELEKKIVQLCSENQILFNLASQNEALASRFKTALDQFLMENAAAEAPAPPQAIEGYGDTNGTPFPANDAQSCFKNEETKKEVCRRMVCKVCLEKRMSVLVLHCRHLCLCTDCETKVDSCPICNRPKEGSIQIALP